MLVRPARAEDKDAIVDFCQNTFEWGDYIPRVWDSWLADQKNKLLVGVVNGRPVGLLHVLFLETGQAWLEGMRVHPDFRRLGVGTAMDIDAREQAAKLGYHIARLVTSVDNLPAQRTLPTQGYHFLARFNNWKAPPAELESTPFPVAVPGDLPVILMMWNHSRAREAGSGLLAHLDWKWTELTEHRLLTHIDAGEVRMAPRGFAILHPFEEEDERGIEILALCGDEETSNRLALGARAETHYRGYSQVEAILAEDDQLATALSNAGYMREGGELVYEQTL
ncbi:MAG: GNAT family N-acetyltransferase [Chloroflexi bacterium]|nr:GNAT family N-acetyltransferase [Chloroflexota bacterium]